MFPSSPLVGRVEIWLPQKHWCFWVGFPGVGIRKRASRLTQLFQNFWDSVVHATISPPIQILLHWLL